MLLMLGLALGGTCAASAAMAVLWLVQRRTRNAGIVDAGWALTVGVLAVAYAVLAHGWPGRRLAIAVVMGLWSVRLGAYILQDRVIGRPEDARYTALRREWGAQTETRLFRFFQIQAAAAAFFALPALLASADPHTGLRASEWAALVLWGLAFAGERAADRQLQRFREDTGNKGRTCRDGWWRYSRHPNYFFEWLMWVAYALFAAMSPWGFIALACPAAMLYFLLRVTGIPTSEAQALRSRGDDYRRYQETTNAFFPWWPRA